MLNHLQPKRKDSTEDWPAFRGSTEKTSHCSASNCPFVLNRCLSSCLKSLFSFCLLEFEPPDHLDGGKTSLNLYCSVSPRGGAPRSDTGNYQPPAPLLPPPVDADLPSRVGPGGSYPLKISMKTRCSPEGWSKVTTEEQDAFGDFSGSPQRRLGLWGDNGN